MKIENNIKKRPHGCRVTIDRSYFYFKSKQFLARSGDSFVSPRAPTERSDHVKKWFDWNSNDEFGEFAFVFTDRATRLLIWARICEVRLVFYKLFCLFSFSLAGLLFSWLWQTRVKDAHHWARWRSTLSQSVLLFIAQYFCVWNRQLALIRDKWFDVSSWDAAAHSTETSHREHASNSRGCAKFSVLHQACWQITQMPFSLNYQHNIFSSGEMISLILPWRLFCRK